MVCPRSTPFLPGFGVQAFTPFWLFWVNLICPEDESQTLPRCLQTSPSPGLHPFSPYPTLRHVLRRGFRPFCFCWRKDALQWAKSKNLQDKEAALDVDLWFKTSYCFSECSRLCCLLYRMLSDPPLYVGSSEGVPVSICKEYRRSVVIICWPAIFMMVGEAQEEI